MGFAGTIIHPLIRRHGGTCTCAPGARRVQHLEHLHPFLPSSTAASGNCRPSGAPPTLRGPCKMLEAAQISGFLLACLPACLLACLPARLLGPSCQGPAA